MSLAPTTVHGASPADPRLDWRFLLPQHQLGRVATAGPVDPDERAALARHARVLGELGTAEVTPHDVALLADPSLGTVRQAVIDLAIGGSIRIESVARRRRNKVRRVLEAADLDVSTWWHRPSTADTRCLVSLDRPVAAATVLKTVAGRGRRAPIEALLTRWTHPQRWARDVSLLAVAHRTDRAPSEAQRDAHHPDHHEGLLPTLASPDGTPLAALVTPRFAASRAVIGVTTITGGWNLGQVAKVARDPGDDVLVIREAEALQQFTDTVRSHWSAPPNHHLAHHDGRPILVEDAAQGTPLDRRAVRRDPDAALVAGIAWLAGVPVAPPSCVGTDGRADALLRDPLQTLARLGLPAGLVARAGPILDRLRRSTLPNPFEHGDFSHPNLFRQAGGELMAIDWELARPMGLPLHDLTFFVGYLAESVDRPRDRGSLVAAHRRALGSGGWADAAVSAHLEDLGVDPELRSALTVACWTRYLAGVDPSAARRGTGRRYATLWRAAIEDAEAAR